MSSGIGLIIMLVIFAVLMILDVPIYATLLGCAIFLQVIVCGTPPTNIITGIYEALTKTSLMAVPYFVLAGAIMAYTSLGKRLINLFDVLLSGVKSGLALSCLVANAFFGAMSGSAPAATATFGKVTYKPLKDRYGDDMATGLITSSGALSVIIPPSISIILYAIAAETSTTKLFIAGIVPGILIVIIVAVYLAIKCRKLPKQARPTAKAVGKAIVQSIPVMILPVIILGGIYGGIFTPTEAGAASAVYALLVSLFVLKDIRIRDLKPILKDAAATTSQIFILVAVSTSFAQACTMAHIQDVISALLSGTGKVAFLLILNVILLILGCFIDGGSATLIVVPLILPMAVALNINPMHLGIISVVNLAIGLFTPPFGLNIFVAQSVMKRKIGAISKSVLPFIACYIIALLLITFIPEISLVLLG